MEDRTSDALGACARAARARQPLPVSSGLDVWIRFPASATGEVEIGLEHDPTSRPRLAQCVLSAVADLPAGEWTGVWTHHVDLHRYDARSKPAAAGAGARSRRASEEFESVPCGPFGNSCRKRKTSSKGKTKAKPKSESKPSKKLSLGAPF